MIGDLIGNYGDVGALAILVGLMVWYLKHQTKRQAEREDGQDKERIKRQEERDKEQKEERNYYRGLIKDDIRKNVDLNVKGITLQKEIMKDFKDHNSHAEKFSEKVVESLGLICDKLNSGSTTMKIAKKKLNRKKIVE